METGLSPILIFSKQNLITVCTNLHLELCNYHIPTVIWASQRLFHLILSTNLYIVCYCYFYSLSGKLSDKMIQ